MTIGKILEATKSMPEPTVGERIKELKRLINENRDSRSAIGNGPWLKDDIQVLKDELDILEKMVRDDPTTGDHAA